MRITGASDARSLRCSTSASLTSSSLPNVSTISPIRLLPGPIWVSRARSISDPMPTLTSIGRPQAKCSASMISSSNGSVRATTTPLGSPEIPTTWFSLRNRAETCSGRGEDSGKSSGLVSGLPLTADKISAVSRSERMPSFRRRAGNRVSSVWRARRSARMTSDSRILPRSTRASVKGLYRCDIALTGSSAWVFSTVEGSADKVWVSQVSRRG